MMRRNYSPEAKRRMEELRKEGLTYREIAAAVGGSMSAVGYILHGPCPSHQNRTRSKGKRACPECHGTINPTLKINFCYHCGADLRSEGAKLAPHVEDVVKNISTFYPAHLRDEAIQTLNKVIDILKEA